METQSESTATPEPVAIDLSGYRIGGPPGSRDASWRSILILDPDKRRVCVESIYGAGSSEARWNGRLLDICRLPHMLHSRTLAEIVEYLTADDVQTDLAEVVASYAERFDGHNHVGRISEEACETLEQIAYAVEQLVRDATAEVWPVADYLDPVRADVIREARKLLGLERGVMPTDEQLVRAARSIEERAAASDDDLVGSVEDWLRGAFERDLEE